MNSGLLDVAKRLRHSLLPLPITACAGIVVGIVVWYSKYAAGFFGLLLFMWGPILLAALNVRYYVLAGLIFNWSVLCGFIVRGAVQRVRHGRELIWEDQHDIQILLVIGVIAALLSLISSGMVRWLAWWFRESPKAGGDDGNRQKHSE